MNRLRVLGLLVCLAATLESGLSAWAQAQGVDSPAPGIPAPDAGGGVGSVVAVAIIAALVFGIVLMVRLIDARRRREDRIAGVQGRLSDTLASDPMLARQPLTVTLDAPKWTGGRATVVISGAVSSNEQRAVARRLVESEARARLEDWEVVDRMFVDPQPRRRVA